MDAQEIHMDMIQGESLGPPCKYCGFYQDHDTLPCAEKKIAELRKLLAELVEAAAAYRRSHSTWKEVSDSMLRIDSAVRAAKEAL